MEEMTEDAHSTNSGHQPSLQAAFSSPGHRESQALPGCPAQRRRTSSGSASHSGLYFSLQPQDTLLIKA